MYETELEDRGFIESEPGIYTAEWDESDSTYLADNLDITEDYDTLVIQANTETGDCTVFLDGGVFLECLPIDELIEALDG